MSLYISGFPLADKTQLSRGAHRQTGCINVSSRLRRKVGGAEKMTFFSRYVGLPSYR